MTFLIWLIALIISVLPRWNDVINLASETSSLSLAKISSLLRSPISVMQTWRIQTSWDVYPRNCPEQIHGETPMKLYMIILTLWVSVYSGSLETNVLVDAVSDRPPLSGLVATWVVVHGLGEGHRRAAFYIPYPRCRRIETLPATGDVCRIRFTMEISAGAGRNPEAKHHVMVVDELKCSSGLGPAGFDIGFAVAHPEQPREHHFPKVALDGLDPLRIAKQPTFGVRVGMKDGLLFRHHRCVGAFALSQACCAPRSLSSG